MKCFKKLTSSALLEVENMPVPQETNAVDCGIYTLLFAERLMQVLFFTVYITVERNA